MNNPPDFLEKEIKKLLDIVERQCNLFGVPTAAPSKPGKITPDKEKRNGVKDNA
jgi:hypothetical protein